MLARLSKYVLALTLACSIGLHWAFFQAVAWTGMVASYARSLPISEALEKTFDGKHPCQLCKQIAAGKRSEKKADSQTRLKKLEFPAAPAALLLSGPSSFTELRAGNVSADPLTHAPPVPPPRRQA